VSHLHCLRSLGPKSIGSQLPRSPSARIPESPGAQVPEYPRAREPRSPSARMAESPRSHVPRSPSAQVPGSPCSQVPRHGRSPSAVPKPRCPKQKYRMYLNGYFLHCPVVVGWPQQNSIPTNVWHKCIQCIAIQPTSAQLREKGYKSAFQSSLLS
jgi:hypothetical protein